MKDSTMPKMAPKTAKTFCAPAEAPRFARMMNTIMHTPARPTRTASTKMPDVGCDKAASMRSGCERCVTEAMPPTAITISAMSPARNALGWFLPRRLSNATPANIQPAIPVNTVNRTRDHWIAMLNHHSSTQRNAARARRRTPDGCRHRSDDGYRPRRKKQAAWKRRFPGRRGRRRSGPLRSMP